MTAEQPGYRDWQSIAQAIKSAAQKAVQRGDATDVTAQIMQARFDRFLSRVFADGENSEWLLKGGTSILARVRQSRATKDIDLAGTAADLESAVRALQQTVDVDLGDHVRFELISTRATGLGDNQPGVATRRVVFACMDRATGRKIGDVPVDVVVGPPPVGRPETVRPANRLELPKELVTHSYRLFPIADQIAEKVCATMSTSYPGGQASSRVKDLVDLVIIAQTQQVDLDELRTAIATKRIQSRLPEFGKFEVPKGWEQSFKVLASSTRAAGIQDLEQAAAYVARLVDPALREPVAGEPGVWNAHTGWAGAPMQSAAPDEKHSKGTEVVREHIRSDQPIKEYRRQPRSR